MKNFSFKNRGSAFLFVIGAISVIFILGFSFIDNMIQEFFQAHVHNESVVSYYLAEAGIERAIFEFKLLFEKPLLTPGLDVNQELITILDFNKAQDFTRQFSEKLMRNGGYNVYCEFINLKRTPFYGFLYEKGLPTEIEQYYKDTKSHNSPTKLGGWQGQLKITSTGTYKGHKRNITVIRDIKVMDLTPPASEYTLFVWGEGIDYLKSGTFIVEHGLGHLVDIATGFLEDFNRLSQYLVKGNLVDLINIVKDFVNKTKFTKPKEKQMDEIFKAYKVAGRIRVNGTLHVWLPFFEVDDIISYFVRNIYYEKPAVGYPGCNNRLHDRFMSWATKFEGDIRKHYYELAPYVIEHQKPIPKVEQYTRWSTFPNFLREHPNTRFPNKLKKLKVYEKYATNVVNKSISMIGSKESPVMLDGITLIKGNLTVGGYFIGKGMLVATGNVYFSSSVRHASKSTLLSIISLSGHGIINKEASVVINSALCLRDSIIGGYSMKVNGNYVVKQLNRQKGELGALLMPQICKIKYDKKIRQIRGDNFWISISKRDISRTEDGGS